ncbi:MAG TPA: hypothetical protein VK118_07515 [Tetragenococcus sp.]|nr:hypothetical protein [Tetragenococcus sp.]
MTIKQKKLLFFGCLALMILLIVFFGWKLLSAIIAAGTTDNYTRQAIPHGFALVLLFPVLATSTLFYGLLHSKK